MAIRREVKVGAFVLAGLCVVALVVFLIGEERRAFSTKQAFHAVFLDVQGLRRGSPVRMGGVDIGSVSEVSYAENPKDSRIFVHMSVVESEARRIRADSVATIEGKGLLGDKMIVVTVGSPTQPQLKEGSEIRSRTAEELTAVMARLGQISAQVEKVVNNLERTTDSLADRQLHDDLKTGVGSLTRILGSLERQEGYVGKLLSDPAEARRVSQSMQNLERVTAQLEQTTRSVNQILGRVQSGPGLAHELVYGEDSGRAVSQFGGAAEELAVTLKGIREGKGLARGLLFGDEGSDKLAADLSVVGDDLKQIVADLRAGKGTLGALLVDPSVYEDLKLVLGNVQRNKALRALVRYSIRQDETVPRVEDRDPGVSASGSTPKPAPAAKGALEGAVGGRTEAAESAAE